MIFNLDVNCKMQINNYFVLIVSHEIMKSGIISEVIEIT